ncbi:DUF3219 domain-containing protein [Bacillus sp. AFS076308]|uniref:DUF3219 family protein n=1 Tax=unclassified Bacillus (in: firmicutes) TaxID=185979 RepID=UPI000BFA54CB|nr:MULTISPECIES: DUF3219 family protein [unclassified Bacillus (in: firmicutes)]PFN96101.1 DUF3219 domain-containing protein [Bacillus sp. AFS076308]PGV55987.1 DUF3219 domain-containing protein [Bacillus sp. AFS037270]
MVNELILNDTAIKLDHYDEEKINNLYRITVTFKVTSEDYHDLTTLLYKGSFDVKIPERKLTFRGAIQQYSTSVTNLYEKDQVGEYKLCLLETSH